MRLHRTRSGLKWLMLLFLLACLLWGLVSPVPPKLAAQSTIKRSSSAIAVTSDGAFCLAWNKGSSFDRFRHSWYIWGALIPQ